MTTIGDRAFLMSGPPGFVRGWSEPLTFAQSAVGQVITHKVPGEYYERFLTIHFRLVTSAVVANRIPRVRFLDESGNRLFTARVNTAVAASTTAEISFAAHLGAQSSPAAGSQTGCIPDLVLPSSFSIEIGANALDAGDAIDQITAYVNRFSSDHVSYTETAPDTP